MEKTGQGKVLYTRRVHGGLPVEVIRAGYRLHRPDGSREDYGTARQLLLALHGGRDSGMTFDRYFRQGRHAPTRSGNLLSVLRTRDRRHRGIDLARRGDEVAKLLRAACGRSIEIYGYDFQEVLQEVYKGILIRNHGESYWTPWRGSFGHYVTMVCVSVFCNFHKREKRRMGRERTGTFSVVDEGMVDVASKAVSGYVPDAHVEECIRDLAEYMLEREDSYRKDSALARDAALAREVLPYMYMGMRRGEIADVLGEAGPAVGRAMAFLRKAAHDWKELRCH